ncbi:MAG: hypothetical protein NDI67_00990 [Sulfuritalea sp.]|nr:hypothetical protein [Sulfuritalea sp.]
MIRYLLLAAVLIPIFLGAFGGMIAGNASANLKDFCARFPSGTGMAQFRAAATSESFVVFNHGDVAAETAESQIAAKLTERIMKSNGSSSGQVAVIVKKPGIGYYACIVDHDGRTLSKTEYIAND